jgi:hypothetical protein
MSMGGAGGGDMEGIRLSPCIFERQSEFKKRKKCAKF